MNGPKDGEDKESRERKGAPLVNGTRIACARALRRGAVKRSKSGNARHSTTEECARADREHKMDVSRVAQDAE